jgi:hypothetical protein
MSAADDLRDLRDALDSIAHGALPRWGEATTKMGEATQAAARVIYEKFIRAVMDASNAKFEADVAKRCEDQQRAHAEALTAHCEAVERERDEWKARATFAEKELSDAFGLPPTIGPSGGEAKRVVDRLRAERRQLRRRLVECRPWVGVCPLEPAKINEVCLVRDLADDTLEEVKE